MKHRVGVSAYRRIGASAYRRLRAVPNLISPPAYPRRMKFQSPRQITGQKIVDDLDELLHAVGLKAV
jgi:hypothetical protein